MRPSSLPRVGNCPESAPAPGGCSIESRSSRSRNQSRCATRVHRFGGAHHILGPFGADSDLRRWGLELAERGGEEREETSSDRGSAKARGVAASIVGEWRSLRTAAQPPTSRVGDSCLVSIPAIKKHKATSPKSKRRVPVTASNAWPTSVVRWIERSTIRWQHRLKREHPTCTERTIAHQRERMVRMAAEAAPA